jgi:hypothetical protein
LRYNAENFEAFNRLVANYLLTREEKKQLVDEMKFSSDNLWLKDFYLSKIDSNIRDINECEGVMTIRSALNNTTMQGNIGDESGASPSRLAMPDYLDNEDPNDTLRNPNRVNAVPYG